MSNGTQNWCEKTSNWTKIDENKKQQLDPKMIEPVAVEPEMMKKITTGPKMVKNYQLSLKLENLSIEPGMQKKNWDIVELPSEPKYQFFFWTTMFKALIDEH